MFDKSQAKILLRYYEQTLSNFMKCQLCTRILSVSTLCLPIAHIHRWNLWKNHPFAVLSSKMQQKQQQQQQQKNTHTHTSDKTTEIRNIKL